MVTVGAVELLIAHLYSDNEQVHTACSIALGYLSYNPTGMRQLLTKCRNTPGLYQLLMKPKPTMNKDFVDEFRCFRIIGLPSLRCVCMHVYNCACTCMCVLVCDYGCS